MKKYIPYVVMIVVIISVVSLFLWIDRKPEVVKEEFEPIPVTDPGVQLLYSRANPSDSVTSLIDVYRKESFSNEFILGTAFVDYLKEHPNAEVVDEKEIDKSIKKIFGDTTYAHDSGYIVSSYVCAFRYNKGEKNYTYLTGCDGSLNTSIDRKIVSARKSETEYIITEKMIYIKSDWDTVMNTDEEYATIKVYRDVQESKQIDEIKYLWETDQVPHITIDDYLENASTYEYHFVFDGENFVYKKLEKIN